MEIANNKKMIKISIISLLIVMVLSIAGFSNLVFEKEFSTVKLGMIYFNKYRILPGNTGIASISIYPPDHNVSYSIVRRSDSGVQAYIYGVYGIGTVYAVIKATSDTQDGWITLRAQDAEMPGCYRVINIEIGCPPCDGPMCKLPGSGDIFLYSINAVFNLGLVKEGQPAGQLILKSDHVSSDLSTPKALKLYSSTDQLKTIYENGSIRQVSTPQTVVDIIVKNDFHYEIIFYKRNDAVQETNDEFYRINSGADPIVIWQIKNPDESHDVYNQLLINEIRGDITRTYKYAWDESQSSWSLDRENGLQILSKRVQQNKKQKNKIITETVSDVSGEIASVIKKTFHEYLWGEELIEVTIDPDGAALTTKKEYYDQPGQPGSYRKLRQMINPDQSWRKYSYDEQGRISSEINPWLDSSVNSPDTACVKTKYSYVPVNSQDDNTPRNRHKPRKITIETMGKVTSLTYHVFYTDSSGNHVEIKEECTKPTAPYGDQNNLRTITTTFPMNKDSIVSDKVKKKIYPDGRVDTYSYETGAFHCGAEPQKCQFSSGDGKYLRKTIVHGTLNHPEGIVNQTTQEIIIKNELGHERMREKYVYTNSGFARIQWQVSYLDDYGREINSYHSNGAQTQTVWGCCHKESDTDEQGVTKTYEHDGLNRLIKEVKEGYSDDKWPSQSDITTTFTYNAISQQLTQTVKSENLSLISSNEYDLAGRIIKEKSFENLVTKYVYDPSGLATTIIKPGGATEVTSQHLDGQTKQITGTGVIPIYYEYGITPDGSKWEKQYIQKNESPMWKKTTANINDQIIKIEKTGFEGTIEYVYHHYNNSGQLVKTETSGLADTLYEYNELGVECVEGLDINDNGVLDRNGPDRITENETQYVLIDQQWWKEGIQKIYGKESSPAATTTDVQRMLLTGLNVDGKTEEIINIDIFGNQTISQVFTDIENKTETRIINSSDSSINEISVFVNGLLMSSQTKTGIKTTYQYDALGRVSGVTYPRTGTVTYHYNVSLNWIIFNNYETCRLNYMFIIKHLKIIS